MRGTISVGWRVMAETSMQRDIRTGWRRAISLLVAITAVGAGLALIAILRGPIAWIAFALLMAIAFAIGRRVTWSHRQWVRHVEFRRGAARELRHADEGGRTRPLGW